MTIDGRVERVTLPGRSPTPPPPLGEDPDLEPGFPVDTYRTGGTYTGGPHLGMQVVDLDRDPDLGGGRAPAIADVDGDGRNEIVIGSDEWEGEAGWAPTVWLYDLGNGPHGPVEWAQFMSDAAHSGRYHAPANAPSRRMSGWASSGRGFALRRLLDRHACVGARPGVTDVGA